VWSHKSKKRRSELAGKGREAAEDKKTMKENEKEIELRTELGSTKNNWLGSLMKLPVTATISKQISWRAKEREPYVLPRGRRRTQSKISKSKANKHRETFYVTVEKI